MNGLELTNVTFSYGASTVIHKLNLRVKAGHVTVLAGPNGAGKSTVLSLAAGLLTPTQGMVTCHEGGLHDIKAAKRAQLFSFVGQVEEMPFAFTALEVVLMGRAPYLQTNLMESSTDVGKGTQSLIDMGCEPLSERIFHELSQGERQRILIARALCQDTPILLMDEPTSHLDPRHALDVVRLCRQLAAAGKTVVVVMHDLNLAAMLADDLVFLKEGEIVAQGASSDLLTEDTIAQVYGIPCRVVDGDPPAVLFS
jgi:iron complex transport system ATP-binding protein